jgi:hypothetical protein
LLTAITALAEAIVMAIETMHQPTVLLINTIIGFLDTFSISFIKNHLLPNIIAKLFFIKIQGHMILQYTFYLGYVSWLLCWTGGRVVEGARLESVYTGNRIVGSNPTPSAITPYFGLL